MAILRQSSHLSVLAVFWDVEILDYLASSEIRLNADLAEPVMSE